MLTQAPVPTVATPAEAERHDVQAAAGPDDAFDGAGGAPQLGRSNWLKKPWRPVGRLFSQVVRKGEDQA